MEKPKYEKPIVMDLNGNSANGAPLACIAGGSVDSSLVCYTGTVGYLLGNDCQPGGVANYTPGASCITGGIASLECAGGSTGDYHGGCTSGPTP
jgi:hypothetical protein